MFDRLFKRPPAGISIAEQAKLGSQLAREKVEEALNERPPAGLSLKELAEVGLPSAQEKVKLVTESQ